MIISDMAYKDFFSPIWRAIGSFIDRAFYALLEGTYRLFFAVSEADIISGPSVASFFGRVQLILGIFMMFQLAITIIKGIVNPDGLTDSKSGGGNNIIMRIITALLILTLLVPVNFANPRNKYEEEIRDNGILFGTLYSLQYRVLHNNTIGRLILGHEGDSQLFSTSDTGAKKAGRTFATTVVKMFYRINLLPGKESYDPSSNRVCPNNFSDAKNYMRADAGPGDIIDLINKDCVSGVGIRYFIAYTPVFSFIVAGLFAFLFISFSVDVAVRAAKLAFLRLLSPIPVISYMDPNGSKDNMFNSWVKLLTSTYIDLFVRLAAVNLALFVVAEILTTGALSKTGTLTKTYGAVLGTIADIVVIVGVLVFARQAPKFVNDMLGLKGNGLRLFGGFQDLRATASMATAPVSGAVAGAVAGKGVVGKIGGAFSGLVGGGSAAAQAYFNNGEKPLDVHAVDNARIRYQEQRYARAGDGSTFLGRTRDTIRQQIGMRTRYDVKESEMASLGILNKSGLNLEKELYKNTDDTMTITGVTHLNASGKQVLNADIMLGGETLMTANRDVVTIKGLHELLLSLDTRGISKDNAVYQQIKKMQDDLIGQKLHSVGNGTVLDGEENLSQELHQWATSAYENRNKIHAKGVNLTTRTSVNDIMTNMGTGDLKISGVKGVTGDAGSQVEVYNNSNEKRELKADASRATENNRGGGGSK